MIAATKPKTEPWQIDFARSCLMFEMCSKIEDLAKNPELKAHLSELSGLAKAWNDLTKS